MKVVLIASFLLVTASCARSAEAGVCIGDAFLSGVGKPERQQGPDFIVDRFAAPSGNISVYVGRYSQVSNAKVSRFVNVDDVAIWRTAEQGEFAGYLAEIGVQQLHFFGTGLKGDQRDAGFFKRLSFVRGRQENCGSSGASS